MSELDGLITAQVFLWLYIFGRHHSGKVLTKFLVNSKITPGLLQRGVLVKSSDPPPQCYGTEIAGLKGHSH